MPEFISILNTLACFGLTILAPSMAAFDTTDAFTYFDLLGYVLDAIVLLYRLICMCDAFPIAEAFYVVYDGLYDAYLDRRRIAPNHDPTNSHLVAPPGAHAGPPAGTIIPAPLAQMPVPDDLVRTPRKSRRRARAEMLIRVRELTKFLLCVPYDALLWPTPWREAVSYVRLLRLITAPIEVHNFIAQLERSQTIPFAMARVIRLVSTAHTHTSTHAQAHGRPHAAPPTRSTRPHAAPARMQHPPTRSTRPHTRSTASPRAFVDAHTPLLWLVRRCSSSSAPRTSSAAPSTPSPTAPPAARRSTTSTPHGSRSTRAATMASARSTSALSTGR